MSRLVWGIVVWLPSFLALELTAKFWDGCPWPTLSETVWLAIRWWHPIATLVAVIMIVLYGHFEDHWRVRYLIAVSLVGAASIVAHILLRR
ncbi:MAG: hypothetical protein KGL39_46530 [Patescibacteria group bacterium]|nr:hypothetical protein [Patescibacteria group bacterium]